ncbi:MAG: Integral membrane protein TerC [uncultured Thermomicrobiales bacterium]|uniref:Integral membrane protein TerC n=1 Tax=uncultured Thermomicrobiales bacterium TaxID=1645740 RepID=A0A6J4VD39_9BACT|nr:MAG: Integral membrane protein TerC [uncultured Thermomicrobiales bacterium]
MGRDLILPGKGTYEIHEMLEGQEGHADARVPASFASVIVRILILDVVFSLDSVISAAGMVDQIGAMIAIGIMLLSTETISAFANRHPTVKMLALSFLLPIGMSLVVKAFDQHIPMGYIYFAMGFSVFAAVLNLRAHGSSPVHLHERYSKCGAAVSAAPAGDARHQAMVQGSQPAMAGPSAPVRTSPVRKSPPSPASLCCDS